VLAVIKDPSKPGVVLEDVPVPQVGPWEVLVRVRAVGICGSDQRIYNDVNPARRRRFIIGHEIAGDVEMGDRGRSRSATVGVEICVGCGSAALQGRLGQPVREARGASHRRRRMTEYVAVLPAPHSLLPALYEKAVRRSSRADLGPGDDPRPGRGHNPGPGRWTPATQVASEPGPG
jgi:threonine dehydrogenase-like Zn-dependent dehydrogenase